MNIRFCISKCPVDFDVVPYLRFSKTELSAKDEKAFEETEREILYLASVLANQVDCALTEQGKPATVYKLPMNPNAFPFNRPILRLAELCDDVSDDYEVFIGYKRCRLNGKDILLPEIRLACLCDSFGEFTSLDVLTMKAAENGIFISVAKKKEDA